MNDMYSLACICLFQHNSASQRFSMKHWNGYITSEYQLSNILTFQDVVLIVQHRSRVQTMLSMNGVYSLACMCILQHNSAYQRFSMKYWNCYISSEYQSIQYFDLLGCGLDCTAPIQAVDYAMNDVHSLACICIFQHNSAYQRFSMKHWNGYITSEYQSIQYFTF